jgi:hypothetical protein
MSELSGILMVNTSYNLYRRQLRHTCSNMNGSLPTRPRLCFPDPQLIASDSQKGDGNKTLMTRSCELHPCCPIAQLTFTDSSAVLQLCSSPDDWWSVRLAEGDLRMNLQCEEVLKDGDE